MHRSDLLQGAGFNDLIGKDSISLLTLEIFGDLGQDSRISGKSFTAEGQVDVVITDIERLVAASLFRIRQEEAERHSSDEDSGNTNRCLFHGVVGGQNFWATSLLRC